MRKGLEFLVAVVLSVLFAVALLYVTLEFPRVIHGILLRVFPDCWWPLPGRVEIGLWRVFGYLSFAVTVLLILAGFLTQRLHLSTLGSMTLFLPTFGYFASTMFFLAGVGALRALWLPWLDLSPNALRLGDVVYVPYILLSFLTAPIAWVTGTSPSAMNFPLSLMVTLAGLMVFLLGTITWLYGRFTGLKIIDFWIYRYLRHPQYLGFLLWSYGLLLLVTFLGAPMGGYVPPPSLPWLISALSIIGVALHEENTMIKRHGEQYVRYRNDTSFMLPLPKQLSTLIVAPVRILLKKNWPENGKEVACTITVYGTILILISLPIALLP